MTPGEWQDEDPEAAEVARQTCKLLAKYSTEAAPPGVEAWGSYAFEVVAPFEVEFLLALVAYERDSSDENTLRLRGAIGDVVDAWQEVALRYDFRPLKAPR